MVIQAWLINIFLFVSSLLTMLFLPFRMEPTNTTWHTNPTTASSSEIGMNEASQNLTAVASRRVWDEMYVCKKPAIEEVFKVSLPSQNNDTPELKSIRHLIYEPATKLWLNYVDMEKRGAYHMSGTLGAGELHSQIQSKLKKVTGGLTRLASRSQARRDDSIKIKNTNITSAEFLTGTLSHVGIVRDLVDLQEKQQEEVNSSNIFIIF